MKKQLCFYFLFITGIFLFGSCKPFYNRFYADPEKYQAAAAAKKPYDVIIIPGCPPDVWPATFTERVQWAVYLYNNGYAKKVMFSGGAVHTKYNEAEAMRLYAIKLGIPDSCIITETEAEHSAENLYNGCKLARNIHCAKVALATHADQASALLMFRKRKYKTVIDFISFHCGALGEPEKPLNMADLEAAAVTGTFRPLEDREGFIKRSRGSKGHNVKVAARRERRADRKAQRKQH